jgi:hypothetical protein
MSMFFEHAYYMSRFLPYSSPFNVMKTVEFCIHLTRDGRLRAVRHLIQEETLVDKRGKKRKKKTYPKMNLPAFKRTGGASRTRVIVVGDNEKYFLADPEDCLKSGDKVPDYPIFRDATIALLLRFEEEAPEIWELQAIRRFLQSPDEIAKAVAQIKKAGGLKHEKRVDKKFNESLVFSVLGSSKPFVHELPAAMELWDRYMTEYLKGQYVPGRCSLLGHDTMIPTTIPFRLNPSFNCTLISAAHSNYRSYDRGVESCGHSVEVVIGWTQWIRHCLTTREHHIYSHDRSEVTLAFVLPADYTSSREGCVEVLEAQKKADLFPLRRGKVLDTPLLLDQKKKVQKALKTAKVKPNAHEDDRPDDSICMATLGRIEDRGRVVNYQFRGMQEVRDNLEAFVYAQRIQIPYGTSADALSTWQLACSLVHSEITHAIATRGGSTGPRNRVIDLYEPAILKSATEGTPLPVQIAGRALDRVINEHPIWVQEGVREVEHQSRVYPGSTLRARLSLLQMYLFPRLITRSTGEKPTPQEILAMSNVPYPNPDSYYSKNPGYLLGRLVATMESVEKRSQRSTNGLSQSLKGVLSGPLQVVPRLLSKCQQAHIPLMYRNGKGAGAWHAEKCIEEVLYLLGRENELPRTLTDDDKMLFFIGKVHQEEESRRTGRVVGAAKKVLRGLKGTPEYPEAEKEYAQLRKRENRRFLIAVLPSYAEEDDPLDLDEVEDNEE